MLHEEQRSNRSQQPDLAIHYQLKQLKADFGVAAILVDEEGTLISASDQDEIKLYRALAAEVTKLAEGSTCRLLFSKLSEIKNIQPNQISAKEFLVKGRRFYVITIGSSRLLRDIGSYRAFFGLRRIIEAGNFSSSVVSSIQGVPGIVRKPEAISL